MPLTLMVEKPQEPEFQFYLSPDAAGTKLYLSKAGTILWPAIGTRPETQFVTNMHSR